MDSAGAQGAEEKRSEHLSLFDAANDAIFVHDAETGRIIDVNRKMTEMYGFTVEEARRLTVEDLSICREPYTQARAVELLRRAATGEPQLFEWHAKDRAGREFWVEVNIKRAAIEGVERLLAIVRDITERKRCEAERAELLARAQAAARQAEEARAEAEERRRELEAIVEAVPDGIFVVERDGRVVVANSAFLAQLGLSAPLRGLPALAEYAQGSRVQHLDGGPIPFDEWPLARALRDQLVSSATARVVRRDGTRLIIQANAAPIRDEGGACTGAVMVSRDVTSRLRWEDERDAVAQVGEALGPRVGLDATAQAVVDVAVGVLRADRAQLYLADDGGDELALRASRNVPPELAAPVRILPDVRAAGPELGALRLLAEAADGGALALIHLERDGRTIGLLCLGAHEPQRFTPDDEGKLRRIGAMLSMALDNARLFEQAERRAAALAEERLRREHFTSLVAHELRGSMSVISGYAALLRQGAIPDEARHAHALEVIATQVLSLDRLISDLLDLSLIEAGRFSVERSPTDLVGIAREVVERYRDCAAGHQLSLALPPEPLVGAWDPGRLAQAASNLVSNAIKYAPPGPIRVAVRVEGHEAVLSVADEGPGITPAEREAIVRPYVRLRRGEARQGVGLGLTIVAAIAAAHGGRLIVESELGQGSTFTLRLPRGT